MAAEGPIAFDRYLDIVLYGAHGFYTVGGSAGRRRGDFITSPEVGPLFGVVIARALDAWWDELGRPDPFTVVDAGAGPGTLARSVLAADAGVRAGHALRRGRDLRPAARPPSRRDRVGERDAVGPVHRRDPRQRAARQRPVPARRVRRRVARGVRDGRRRTAGRGARLGGHRCRPAGRHVPPRARVPIQARAAAWVGDARASLARGRVVVFDYSVAVTAQLAVRPWREWLRTYRAHDRGGHYLVDPGRAGRHLPTSPSTNSPRRAGPTRCEPRPSSCAAGASTSSSTRADADWQASAARPDLRAMAMRSRISEAEALLDPTGLGAFSVVEWSVGESPPGSARRAHPPDTQLSHRRPERVQDRRLRCRPWQTRRSDPRGRGEDPTGRDAPATCRCRTPVRLFVSPRRRNRD